MKQKIFKTKEFFSLSLIAIAVLSRFIPHPPNFSPVASIALLSGYSFSNRVKSFLVPIIAMIISDFFIGFHSTMWAVYLSFSLCVIFGFLLKKNFSFYKLFAFSVASSLLFYLITNFAVWLTSGMYPHTLAGLFQCYTMGLPFYRTSTLDFFAFSLFGDIFYSFVLFGALKLAEKKIPLEGKI
ncbi:MAG: DUF6580 family putative transport protein [Candidatus Kapaibacteriota bacterium]